LKNEVQGFLKVVSIHLQNWIVETHDHIYSISLFEVIIVSHSRKVNDDTVLKKFDGMEDDTRLSLTKMILDYTCEQWVEKYRAGFIHCSCPDSQERLSDRKMDDWRLEMFCVTERKTSPNDS
jgi:hypothetical protein